MTQNHDSCYEVYTNSDMHTFSTPPDSIVFPITSLAYLCSDLVPKITCQVGSPGLSIAVGFEHPASTLPTRFPAALGIGHGRPAA